MSAADKDRRWPAGAVRDGRAGAVAVRDAAGRATAPRGGASGVELQRLVAGVNPLLGAANVLLALVPQLRATLHHADPADLRRRMVERVAEFEENARAGGVPRQKIIAARYVLCTFIDEVVADTPWGSSGAWAERNLLQEYHDERHGGEKAFKLLERLGEDVPGNADLLELFYVCLALGFEGRYKGKPHGRAQLDAIGQRLVDALRPRTGAAQPGTARTLSLRWTGVQAPRQRALAVLPLWVVFAVGGAILLATFLWFNAQLDDVAGPAFRRIAAVPAALRADAPPGGAAPAARPRLQAVLRPEGGAFEVRDEPLRSVVTLPADTLFAAGSAQLDPRRMETLTRIARALAALPGQVIVVGHTDDAQVSSLQFPSNWHLSYARAQAVASALAQRGVPIERLRAEGRADAEPVAANDTPASRARNRRVEVALVLTRPDQ